MTPGDDGPPAPAPAPVVPAADGPRAEPRGLRAVIEARGEERQVVLPRGRCHVGFGAEHELIVAARPIAWPVCVVEGGPSGWDIVEVSAQLRLADGPLTLPHRLAPGDRLALGRVALRIPAAGEPDDLEAQVARARRSSRRTLGRYVLLAELGHGAFSVVHKAWDDVARRLVAVKVLVQLAPAVRARFEREVALARTLAHPGIVPVLDHGEHEGRPFLVMPLVEGRTLEAVVDQEGPLPPRAAATLVRDAARAVAHAHARDVLHRDLKPANLLVDDAGAALLVDFGLARHLRDQGPRLTTTGAFVGTPLYLAPEQALGEGDGRADVYGLAAVLYFALTGRPPLDDASLGRYLDQLQRAHPDPPSAHRPGVDAGLDAVALRGLARDPAARYPTAAALADDLDRWLRGEPVTAPPPARPRAGVAVAVGLVAALGALLALAAAVARH